uniref:Uncharacterized protein n=1 Tax=Stomoxys calcitrans TaxID=35570 RepID=A0A1I8NRY1_STOCA
MDPSRHHDFVGNNEERSRAAATAAYYSREVPDIASHRYYGSTLATVAPPQQQQQQQSQQPPARSHSNTRNLLCDCTTTPSGARITCNGCRLNPPPGDVWSNQAMAASSSSTSSSPLNSSAATEQQLTQRVDYRQMVNSESMRSSATMRQNPMYPMHSQQQQPPPPHTQQMQHHQTVPPPHPPHSNSQVISHGPLPPSQSMVHTHPSHAISRSNYWSQNPSSTSQQQHYVDEHHMVGVPPNHPVQSTTQTQIDISITRRSAAAPSGPVEGNNMYGQYKSASMTSSATHPSHTSSSYPPPPSSNPLHQRVSAIGGPGPGAVPNTAVGVSPHYVTKERIYETKYSTTTTTTKIAYNSTSSAAIYDNHHHMNNMAMNNKSSAIPPIDHHVINPSNLPASKDQHPSPNYARKCPQMYTPEAEQSTSHHHHLYMPTPQFSSDKFSRASPQQVPPDFTKLRESPLQATANSPYMVVSGADKYNHMASTTHLRESPQQFVTQQPSVSRNSNPYYAATATQNPSKVHPPEMSPIIMKQTHTHQYHQYSKSPLPPPLPPSASTAAATHHPMHQIPPSTNMGAKANAAGGLAPPPANHTTSQRYIVDSVKREDLEIYENPPPMQQAQQQSSRNSSGGIYINPYNTPPPGNGDSCCKDVSPMSTSTSPYTIGGSANSSYRVESPQFYHNAKYGKISMSSDSSSNKHSLLNQNTPPPSRAPSQRGHQQPAYYYESNPHSAPSPAAATAASPSPSLLSSSSTTTSQQTQIHHTEYLQGVIGTPISQSYPTQPTAQHQTTTAAALRNSEMIMGPQNPVAYERTIAQPPHSHSHAHHQAPLPIKGAASAVPPSSLQLQSAAHLPHSSKIAANVANTNKHKPNYRELISRTLAMRNATSEEELNMQIIKKTLNVDSQNMRGPPGAVPPAPMPTSNARAGALIHSPHHHTVHASPNERLPPTAVRTEIGSSLHQQTLPQTKAPLSSVLVNHHNSAVPLIASSSSSSSSSRAETSRICIKQEDDKPSSSSSSTTTTSPLDLSMRTVKTKADSTEYKYQQRRLTPTSNEGRYTLPRVDSTPVFSVHAFEPAAAAVPAVDITASRANSSQVTRSNNALERRNYTPPSQAAGIQQTPAQHHTGRHYSPVSMQHQQYPLRKSESSSSSSSLHIKGAYESSCVIKTAPKPIVPERELLRGTNLAPLPPPPQSRPSVLETNPYASVIKTEPKRIAGATESTAAHVISTPSAQLAASTNTTAHHTLAAVERLPPDTSIMALPPKSAYNVQNRSATSMVSPPVATASILSSTASNYSQGCERNPNFRKRHIQEYSSQMSANEPIVKQSRYVDSPPIIVAKPAVIPMRPADISVIAVNESNQHELENCNKAKLAKDILPITTTTGGGVIAAKAAVVQPAPVIVNNHSQHHQPSPAAVVAVVCKQEPLTPTGEMSATPVIKSTEVSASSNGSSTTSLPQPAATTQISASRIRTKAELKGFTFNPPPLTQTESEPPPIVTIKQEEETEAEEQKLTPVKVKEEEPETTMEEEVACSIPGLEDNFAESNLLDFGVWSNTCNNFVEQLQTRPAKKKALPAILNKTTPVKDSQQQPSIAEMVVSSTDIPPTNRKTFENHYSPMESADTTRSSFARFEAMESGIAANTKSSSMNQDALNSPNSSVGVIHKKLNKIGREKKRFQQEKRLAERLQAKESSSESEDELDKRKTERLKKPLMKAKTKLKSKGSNGNDTNSSSNLQNEKNRFSDCGSDSSSSSSPTNEREREMPNSTTKEISQSTKSPKKELSSLNSNTTNSLIGDKALGKDIKPKEQNKAGQKSEKSAQEENKTTIAPKKPKSLMEASISHIKSATAKDVKNKINSSNGSKISSSTSVKAETKKEETSSSSSSEETSNEDEDQEEEVDKKHRDNNKSLRSSGKVNTTNTGSSTKGSKLKIGLNTMTRSKLKKELEMQMANSKVLRNDKIIRNSTTKIKRKYVRKYVNNANSYLESGGLSRESGIMKSSRLKAKRERNVVALNLLKAKDNKSSKHIGNSKEAAAAKHVKSENVHDPNVLELYRFKRALKVPPSLISIKHPGAHKIAASLPDLERHAEAYAKKKKKATATTFKPIDKKKHNNEKSMANLKSGAKDQKTISCQNEEPLSIIDVLHSRVTKASGLNASNKTTTNTASKPIAATNKTGQTSTSTPKMPYTTASNCGMFSETSQTTETSELQMQPPLRQESDEDEDDDNESANSGKKRHFSIFDTTVLPTKTRTESKLQQKRENIREIFVGDDRPASAPPEMTQPPDNVEEKMTYEQTYEQFLQRMNIVISGDKFGRLSRTAAARKHMLPSQQTTGTTNLNIKQEEVDTESTSVMDADELKEDQKSSESHTIRKKRGKYLRRKGSSGFDYIRKKKKPSSTSTISSSLHNHNSTNSSFHHHYHHVSIKMEKLEADEYEHKVKTEDDVSREIQKWVLNKGVGQSTMHKAARQGYIDVIVYCLERMSMNPDHKDNAGYTPLHEACTNGWLDIARVLLQYGANHSAAAHSGIRPLHEASENDHEEIVRLLLSYGADPLLATYSGQTPLMLASSTTMRDILNNHLLDVQSMGPDRKPWKFNGPWELYDPSECGYNVFEGAPNPLCDMSRALFRRGSLTNNQMMQSKQLQQQQQQNVLNANATNTNSSSSSSSVNNTFSASTAMASDNSNKISQNGPTSSSSNSATNSGVGRGCDGKGGGGITTSGTSYLAKALKAIESAAPSPPNTATTNTTATASSLALQQQKGETSTKTVMDKCAVVLDKIDQFNSVRLNSSTTTTATTTTTTTTITSDSKKSEILVENSDSDGEMFEFEEADILLPPLYLLKDEGTNDKWVLLSDLCNLLKVKSKDTLLNKVSSRGVVLAGNGGPYKNIACRIMEMF